MGWRVALLTNQQLKMLMYGGAAIIAFNYLRAKSNGKTATEQAASDITNVVIDTAKGVGEAVGVQVVKPAAQVIAEAVKKPFKAIYSGIETEFLMNVESLGGIKLYTVGEKQLALEYMSSTAAALDSIPVLNVWTAVNAYRAAQAVKEYRNHKADYQPWGVQ